MKGDRERCLAAGMDGYLSKPIRPLELDAVLKRFYVADSEVSLVDVPKSTNTAVSSEELLERIDGDRTFLAELVSLFRLDYPAQIQMAREAVSHNDVATLQKIGHALKGALANLAATDASKSAGELEAMAKAGDLASVAAKLAVLETELTLVGTALEELCLEPVR
jgi:HPt (histidine-containing phosphotransfer) domain-containing protein